VSANRSVSTQLPAGAWQDAHMRRAWRTHDFRAVFHLACKAGLTPEIIADNTGLPLHLVNDVMKGNVVFGSGNSGVVDQVAAGFAVPDDLRGTFGLAPRAVDAVIRGQDTGKRERSKEAGRLSGSVSLGSIEVPAEFWDEPDTIEALRAVDIGRLFALLCDSADVSQTQIGMACGMPQGTVSDIIRGIRKVGRLAVIDRIATGLNMPDYARMILGIAPKNLQMGRTSGNPAPGLSDDAFGDERQESGQDDEPSPAVTLLQAARRALGWSQGRAVWEIVNLAQSKKMTVASAPSLKTQLSRWENGHVTPGYYRPLLCELYRKTPRELGFMPSVTVQQTSGSAEPDSLILGVPTPSLVEESTADAAEIVMSVGRELIDQLAIEQFFEEIARLSIAYIGSTVEANRQILRKATALRRELKDLITTHRKPSQAADIYLMIGLLSGICAYSCLDLDRPDEAMTQARASFMMGDLAEHDGLRAWALGTRSLIARFQNRYPEALAYAREGIQYATTGTALVRLRCGEGQTLAHMGDASGAIQFLNFAKDAREKISTPDLIDGLFTFSEAKQVYYTGSSLQWLPGGKNATSAEAESMRAIEMFKTASPENRSPGDILLAHIYLGNSRLTLGEIEGSIEALRPVLDLPLSSRSSWQRKRMRQIASRLERGNFSDSRLAIAARSEISSFIETPKA
jgi:transcriptional regulator with XRE-family HTH domain